MANTRKALEAISPNVDESMSLRRAERTPQLGPQVSAKDIGRTPLRKFGRLEISRIEPDPDQPRTQFDEEELKRLADSLASSTGQIHPIGVRWDATREKWIIVTGERRYRAAKLAGLEAVECYFEQDDQPEPARRAKQLIENLLREDLKPIEEAQGYQDLMDLNGWIGKEVARALGVSESKVSRALALLDLPPEMQQQIDAGEIPRRTGYELTKLQNPESKRALADQAADGKLSQRQAASKVAQRRGKKRSKPKPTKKKLTFYCSHDIQVVVHVPADLNYDHVVEAVGDLQEEVAQRARYVRSL